MDTFTVRIELGNEAMNSAHDVAASLRRIADKLDSGQDMAYVADLNGNTVGEWAMPHEGHSYPHDLCRFCGNEVGDKATAFDTSM